MSVFTPLTTAQIVPWLAAHGITELHQHRGIAGGTVNTNYWLTTNEGEWILTLVEDRDAAAVEPVVELMAALADQQLAVPQVRRTLDGASVSTLANKPATLVAALPGRQPETDAESCQQIGQVLGQLHQQHLDLPPVAMNFGPTWQAERVAVWQLQLPANKAAHLRQSWQRLATLWEVDLPMAWTHGDLFPDNALFDEGRLSTVIDWYFASWAPCIWDLAVAINAWCAASSLQTPEVQALLAGYQAARPLSDLELRWLPTMREAAALRFWLSRLDAQAQSPASAEVTVKSPDEQENMLLDLQHLHG